MRLLAKVGACLAIVLPLCVVLQSCGQTRKSERSEAAAAKKTEAPIPEPEPPMSLGIGESSGEVRSVRFKEESSEHGEFGQHLSVFAVEYKALGLSSEVYVEPSSSRVVKEVFPGKWVILYRYSDATRESSRFPLVIMISKDDGRGPNGTRINTYGFRHQNGTKLVYQDPNGRTKEVDLSYFDVIP